MQIEIKLETVDERSIPASYQYAFSSALFNILTEHSPELGKKLHEGEFKNRLKLFVISFLNSMPHPKIVPGEVGPSLIFGEKVWFRFASAVPEIIFAMSEALLAAGTLNVLGKTFIVRNIEMVKQPDFQPTMIYRLFGQYGMMICRYNGKTQFPDNSEPDLPDCGTILSENLRHKLLRFREIRPDILSNYLSASGLTEESIRTMKIDVNFLPVKPGLTYKTGLFNIKGNQCRAFRAPFKLSAPEVVHRIAWLCGAGSLNSQCFGFLTTGIQEEAH